MEALLSLLKRILPKSFADRIRPLYHYVLAFGGAIRYGFPGKKITVIGVTGTKGKSTVTELVSAIYEHAGYKTALVSTVRFKIGNDTRRNMRKMTMPGRAFIQKHIHQAIDAKCDVVVVEMTSEGVLQSRHKFLYLDALILTHISPEHIESHGSYENYVEAKLAIARELSRSPKKDRVLVINENSKEAEKFLKIPSPRTIRYSPNLAEVKTSGPHACSFTYQNDTITIPLSGAFNAANALAAISLTTSQGIPVIKAIEALENFSGVRGRMEFIHEGQDFDIVVDYAHTPDSLKSVYDTFPEKSKICVLGGTGGGRDHWKRHIMGGIADANCDHIILTDEDPYDEDPNKIVSDIEKGVRKTPYEIEMDRAKAIAIACGRAKKGDIILITGKGTDPYIMGPNGSKKKWDDAQITRKILRKNLES